MNQHRAIYFDGKSSIQNEVTLKLSSFGIEITYFSDFNSKTIRWSKEDIHVPDITTGQKVILRYGKKFPYESIELHNNDFTKNLLERYELNKKSKKYTFFTENGFKGIAIGVVVFVGVFFLFYKVIIPTIAETAAVTIPIEYEQSFGKSIKQSLIANNEVDSLKTKSLKSFFKKLNYESEYDIDLTVVNSPIQNAFATPGGNIVVFSGIIDSMECPEELAALLGHELIHVNNRHSTKSIFRSLANVIVLSVLLNDVNGITSLIIDNANSINELSFSRSLEKEADTEAIKLMLKNNINPQGMLGLLEQLNEINHGLDIPEFLTTHPITENRIDYIKDQIYNKSDAFYTQPNWQEDWLILKEQSLYPTEGNFIEVFDIFNSKDENNSNQE